ncbi:MAG: hypothetical protein AAF903_12445 [Pseudomonadota bacterium]
MAPPKLAIDDFFEKLNNEDFSSLLILTAIIEESEDKKYFSLWMASTSQWIKMDKTLVQDVRFRRHVSLGDTLHAEVDLIIDQTPIPSDIIDLMRCMG